MPRIRTEATPSVELDRAVAAVGAAIGRLARHLDAEQEIAEKAAQALVEIGPYAAVPMAAILKRSRSPQQKILILGLLVHFGPRARDTAGRACLDLMKREQASLVGQCAARAQTELILQDIQGRSHVSSRS